MPRRKHVFGEEPVLLLRTGQHLPVALQAIERAWPGCEVAVVGTPGSETAIEQAGVPADRIFVYRTASSFQPFAFWRSRLIERTIWPQVRHEIRRAVASCVAAVVLGALFVPAWLRGGRT